MAAIADPEMSEPFGRYRFRGIDPKAVERWAVKYENENADLRRQVAALEARTAEADTFAEEALIEATALREAVARHDGERDDFAARQRIFRDEAAQIIHDAWAEANVVRAQTQQLADRTQAQLEAAKIERIREIERLHAQAAAEIATTVEQVRRTLATELETQQAHIATLERRRARLIGEIEASTANVLNGIAPLKESLARTHPGRQGKSHEGDASRAVDDAMEALAELAATMQQSLNAPPSGGREPALNGAHAASIGDGAEGHA